MALPPSLEQAEGMPIPMTNYSFGGDVKSSITSDFQGKGYPSTKLFKLLTLFSPTVQWDMTMTVGYLFGVVELSDPIGFIDICS